MPKGMFGSFDVSASGLSAQRRRLDVIAENLANSETTRTPEGGPYRRKRAVMGSDPNSQTNATTRRDFMEMVRTQAEHMDPQAVEREARGPASVHVRANIEEDPAPFRSEYDPGHPDANAEGYVLKPNVNVVDEMVELILATRAYQANAVAFEAAKDMFTVSLQI